MDWQGSGTIICCSVNRCLRLISDSDAKADNRSYLAAAKPGRVQTPSASSSMPCRGSMDGDIRMGSEANAPHNIAGL